MAGIEAVLQFLSRDPAAVDETAVLLRDSMVYRAESVIFHLQLLNRQFAALTHQAQPRVLAGHPSPHLHRSLYSLTFLSDDVLFNTMSMLDYAGNVAGYALVGQNYRSIKWNGMAKTARDKNNPLRGKQACVALLKENDDWIDKLQNIRSEIIHERVRLGEGTRVTTFGGEDVGLVSRLSIVMPQAVVKRLKFLEADPDGSVPLVGGTEQIALRAMDSAKAVMVALKADLVAENADRKRSPK